MLPGNVDMGPLVEELSSGGYLLPRLDVMAPLRGCSAAAELIMQMDLPEPNWVVPGLIPEAQVSWLASQRLAKLAWTRGSRFCSSRRRSSWSSSVPPVLYIRP